MNKVFNYKKLLILCGVFSLYFFTRLLFLTSFPMLNDESIYLNWAQEIVKNSANLILPVTEGRQPLFIWLISTFMRLFSDPLLAGRLVSVSAGFITLIGIAFVTHEVFKKQIYVLASALLYIISPFALVYDRLALLDSLVTTFTIWSIYFTILLVRKTRLDIAYTLGLVIGGGLLTKSNGVFSLYLLPFSILLFDKSSTHWKRKVFKLFSLILVVFIVSQLINSIMTIIPHYSRILDVNQIFIIPKREFLKLSVPFIFSNLLNNFLILSKYFIEYFTIPYILILIVGIVAGIYKKEKILLLIYFLVPLLVFSLFARQLLPRYIYFMTISLFPICGYGFVRLFEILTKSQNPFLRLSNKNTTKILFSLSILLVPTFISLMVVKDIRTAPIPEPERVNYAVRESDFVKESISIIQNESKNKKVFLAIEGYAGWAPDMYKVYLNKNENVIIKAYFPVKEQLPTEVISASKIMPTYLILPRFADHKLPTFTQMKKIVEKKVILGTGTEKKIYYMRMFELTKSP